MSNERTARTNQALSMAISALNLQRMEWEAELERVNNRNVKLNRAQPERTGHMVQQITALLRAVSDLTDLLS